MISPSRIFSTLVALLLVCGGVFAQEAARPDRGAALNRNYLASDIENINLQNGNVQLSIPLAALPPIAGGKLSWTVSAHYNSKIWDVLRVQEEPLGTVFMPYVVDVPSAGGGWTIGGAYSIQFRNANDDFSRIQYDLSSGLSQGEINLLNNFQYWKVILIAPDGSEHELRPLDHGSYSGSQDFLRGYYNTISSGTPMRYYSLDGSFLYAKISSNLEWTVYMADGTRVIQTPDGVQRIQDTNGNKIKIFTDANGTHFQDEQTTNREIQVVYDPSANSGQGRYRVFYPTVTGIQHFIDVNMGTTIVQGKTYPVSDFDPIGETVCQRTAGLYTELQVVRDIVFPQTEPGQQRKFVFSYNSDTTENLTSSVNWSCTNYENYTRTASIGWGELSRVITPPGTIQTAAYTDYSYELDSVHDLLFSTDNLASTGISQKKLYHDGISDTWTYEIGATGTNVTSPDGNNVTEARYCATFGVLGCSTDKAGLAYRLTRPFVMTEKHWINLAFSGGDNTGPGGLISPFNPVVDYEYTTLLDSNNNALKMSARKFQYDYNGNVTQVIEYDWFDPALVSRDAHGVPIAVPGSATVLRTTNSSHYNQAAGSTSTNVYAKRPLATGAPLILNAPKETTVGASIVQLSYDGQAWGVAPTVGNLTTKKVWVDLDSKWITTSATYNSYGNVLTSTDGRGKVTQFYYDDATHALPNRVVVDPQNGTSTQTTTTSYDYSTGVVTSQTDANGQITTISYTNHQLNTIDPFGRPGVAVAPPIHINGTNHQRRVKTTYLDSTRQVIVETDLNTENDKLLKTRTTTDQVGRTVLTEQTEDGTNYTISSVNKYLDMGRVTLTSSPRRSTSASTDSSTRVTRDNGGRVVEVATFGGATHPAWTGTAGVFTGAVTTDYEANFTTVTDQAGRVRRSMIDALGRLRRVDEPDNGGNLGQTTNAAQPTSYAYDVLGNLTTVTQGSQTRTFGYDSLSRLRTAVNPESGTASYQYDDNGNLVVKTDARSVSTHFEYDSINRITLRWYNSSNSINSTTHNSPALPAGVGATSEGKFYYDSQSLPAGAPSYTRGSAIGRLVAQTYGTGSNGDYFAYNVLGQPTLKIQQTGSVNYQMSADYKLSGALDKLTYPSGHTVAHTYDQAGRLFSVTGNLGDGSTRAYTTGILYSPSGGLLKEQFGTTTPIYNKLFYNSRGQLAEIRASTSYNGPTDYDANRGSIINSYSSQCTGLCLNSSMPDNNGNLKQQDIQVPSASTRSQYYEYDSLNRLLSAREAMSGANQWRQWFSYDRWGNRTIDTTTHPTDGLPKTYGTGINNKQFTVTSANNRLGVPAGQSGAMTYDAAGNLTNDTYTGAGNRTYDAENKITSAWGGNNQAQLYGYDASGQRFKRTVNGVETWQVYGFGGELTAEYAANGAPANPQKEYGYRNGQLLITADGRTNVALSANGGVASASSTHACCGFSVGGAINGNVRGPWGNGEGWNDATENVLPDWFQVDFAGNKTIDEIDVFSLHDNYTEQNTPTETQTFSLYGLVTFQVQYWTGSAWANIPGGNVTGNNKVWRKFAFAPITTNKIRLWITGVPDSWSRLVELQAWQAEPGVTNLALNKPASQSSTAWSAPAQRGIDGNTDGNFSNGSVTHTATESQPWWQVDLQSVANIQNINVWNRTDCCGEALSNFYVFVSDYPFTANDVASTQNQPGVSTYYVTGQGGVPSTIGVNRTGRYVRVQFGITERLSVAEVQVFGGGGGTQVRWLVTDHLGTPRMVLDQGGSLATVKRHDYLPFGEELIAPIGGRTAAQGYAGGDGVRQQFTLKERDTETGLDYFLARYYSSTQGRFTGIDPGNYQARLDLTDPQSWNAYSYVNNNPLTRIDPDGKGFFDKLKNWLVYDMWAEEEEVKREEEKRRQTLATEQQNGGGELIIENLGGDMVRVLGQGDSVNNLTRVQVFFWTNRLMTIHEQGGGRRPLRPGEEVHDAASVGRPALREDPYHPDSVTRRQNTQLSQLRERMQSIGREAERLGFNRRIPPQRAPFDPHGQEVFFDGRRYITRDVDSHIGGVWKMFDRAGRRVGTYDANLNRIGP